MTSLLRLFGLAAALLCMVVSVIGESYATEEPVSRTSPVDVFDTQIRPMLEKNCYGCHSKDEKSGNITLDQFEGDARHSQTLWHKVLHQLRSKSMPPMGEDGPTDELRAMAMSWIKSEVFQHDPNRPDPGVVTVRRLNRIEYRNTIRDLVGVEYDTSKNFPSDDTGYGFDNIADVLTISPLLLEKYVAAAKEIVNQAVPTVSGVAPQLVLLGGKFTKEIRPGLPTDSTTANGVKEKPAVNAFMGPPKGPPKEDAAKLTLGYKEEAIGEATIDVSTTGTYKVVVHMTAVEQYVDNVFDYNRCRMVFKLDEKLLIDREFVRQGGEARTLQFDVDLSAGPHSFVFEVTPLTPEQAQVRYLRLIVDDVTLTGPMGKEHLVAPKNYDRFFAKPVPVTNTEQREYATEILRAFSAKAYRRPVDAASVARLVSLAESVYETGKESFESGIAQAITAILASPRFLFREEGVVVDDDGAHPWLDDYSIASRLSYFLWSTMPDRELMELASQGGLRRELKNQLRRMLNDPRSSAFFQNFVGQWLQSREVEIVTIDAFAVARREMDPDVDRKRARRRELTAKSESDLTDAEKLEKAELDKLPGFRPGFPGFPGGPRGPAFDDKVKAAMRAETEMLFEHVLKNDLPLTELIDSNYTFLNEDLAKFYEIPKLDPVSGNQMRRVVLPDGSMRGGLLTQGTFLAVTSNPNRTSPVKRGLFILENILGTPIAAPPPNIPSLEDAAVKQDGKKQSLRETLTIHRENAVCSSCHNKMDPLGLAFENFNAIGRYREKEFGEAVQVEGTLSSGEAFTNVAELKKAIAMNHKQEMYYCMAEKMMTYALGRGLDFRDNYALDDIVQRIERSDGKAQALMEGVVHSTPFLKRRNPERVVGVPVSQ